MDGLIPEWPDAPDNIGAISTMRAGGVSKNSYGNGAGGGGLNLAGHVGDEMQDVAINRTRLNASLPAAPVWLSQVHGATVVNAATASHGVDADAVISNQRGMVCAVLTADCLPVLLADSAGAVVGAAHAGWRGLANGVLQNTAAAMRTLGAGEITAWLGPAIGPHRFEIGQDVVNVFLEGSTANQAAFVPIPGKSGKFHADIYLLARVALRAAGVVRVAGGTFCTASDRQRFYSYRRDGVTGRMATLIWIK